MGIVKIGAVVFGTFAIGGRVGLGIYNALSKSPTNNNDGTMTDAAQGAVWAGRVVTFLALSYVASKV